MIYLVEFPRCQPLMQSVKVVLVMSKALDSHSTDYIFQITQAVSETENVDSLTLPPLYDHVDTEALSAIVKSGNEDLVIEFSYYGYQISVTGSGSVSVEE